MRILKTIGLTVLLLGLPAHFTSAWAQSSLRIAAIVNDEVISGFDIEQRIRLIIASTGGKDTSAARKRFRAQVLQQLVDERLQLQEAKRYKVRVAKQEIARAIVSIERQNNIPEGGIQRMMQINGISPITLENQLTAELSWSKLVRRRLKPSIQIGEEEIEETLQKFKRNTGKPEHNISEILVPVNSPEKADEARQAAERLAENLNKGGNFSALARQFSASATAARGGNIGWVQPGQLNRDLDAAISGMREGDISAPIRSGGGYYILKLHKRRKILEADPGKTKLTLKRLLLPLAKDVSSEEVKSQSDLAAAVAGMVNGCGQIETVAQELRTKQFGDLGTVKLADMPAYIRAAVRNLPVGNFSKPIRNADGILLLMVCKRVEPPSANITRKQVEDGLVSKRLSVMTQRYIRDLRRSAVVEMR